MLVQQWLRTPIGWESRGYTDRSATDRSSLVRGSYIPDVTTTGPLAGTTFVDQEGSGLGIISLTTTNLNCENTTHWGEVRHQASGIHHNNCRFAGADPDLMYAGTYGASGAGQLVKSYGGASYYHWKADNCLFDPWLWFTERGRTPMTDATWVTIDGVEGGDCELRWCRITHCVDAIHWMQQENITDAGTSAGFSDGTFSSPSGERFAVIDRCLLDTCVYVAGATYLARPGSQSDGRPHCDAIQIMQGHNLWVVGSMVGGTRDSVGYTTWPNDGTPGNTGNDFSNASLMIKQEGGITNPADVRWIDNVLVENCVLGGGGTACVNTYVASNTLGGVTVRNNKFLARQSGWGLGVDSAGTPTSVGGGYGYQIVKGADNDMGANWSGNTTLETGLAIPWPSGSSGS